MLNYQEQLAEFNKKYSSVIDKTVIDLSSTFDKLFDEHNADQILPTIEAARKMLSQCHNIPTQMQINYDIANGYHDYRFITKSEDLQYLEKEIYHLRKVLDLYESAYCDDEDAEESNEISVAKYIAMRSYTNLGNAMHRLGRYIAAIDYFQAALLISKDFAMASLNLSFSLLNYADLQIRPYEQNYYHHAGFYYYEQTTKARMNLEKQEYLEQLHNRIALFTPEYIEQFLKKPLSLPHFHVDSNEEADYRNYLLIFRLFLDPCLDILGDPCFAVDSINLPFGDQTSNREKEFIGLFNQIKQEYNFARYLWYKAEKNEQLMHYADRELDLIDTGDSAIFSLNESYIRTAFKTVYSLFDRIGYFINEYFQVGLTGTNISFKNIWKEKLCDRKGDAYLDIPNPIMTKHKGNPLVRAMFWLQKDFYEDKKTNITMPLAEPIFQMRNDLEHNCLRTGTQSYSVTFTKYTVDGMIENNTYKLLRLARELIIYLCLAIEYDRKTIKLSSSVEIQ